MPAFGIWEYGAGIVVENGSWGLYIPTGTKIVEAIKSVTRKRNKECAGSKDDYKCEEISSFLG
jgi:hypothetical protein